MGRWRLQPGHGGLGGFTVVMVLALASAVSTQANLLFWIVGLLLAAVLLSLASAMLSLRGLEVRRLLPTRTVAGQPLTIHYRLSRRGRSLPLLNAIIRETWDSRSSPLTERRPRLSGEPIGWVAHVGRGEPVIAMAVCRPAQRGLLCLETVEIASSFPFGILRSVLCVRCAETVIVYPRLYRLRETLLGRLERNGGREGSASCEPGGQEEFYGLREYRSGDSVRGIDWRHSARLDRLISREMARASPPQVSVLLDLDRGRLDRLAAEHRERWIEDAIDLAASVVAEAHRRGFAVGLRVAGLPDIHFAPHHSQAHCEAMLRVLALLDTDRTGPARPLRGRPGRATLTIVPGPGADDGRVLASADLANLVMGPLEPSSPLADLPAGVSFPGRDRFAPLAVAGESRA